MYRNVLCTAFIWFQPVLVSLKLMDAAHCRLNPFARNVHAFQLSWRANTYPHYFERYIVYKSMIAFCYFVLIVSMDYCCPLNSNRCWLIYHYFRLYFGTPCIYYIYNYVLYIFTYMQRNNEWSAFPFQGIYCVIWLLLTLYWTESQQKSQLHEILALYLFLVNLKRYEAIF